ncbi:serine hydrolase [Phytoactinopolyspora alkaliphila]|uniref:Serine hydrolase n=1 Tax=Phytoactinopolyspora alkaliphila TaxID=1783498 RepID=A0A6N9YT97_9ACTN|nr:serine hydrolase [Phytoactinopolyspora alkaliphila]NED98256.1 serine hydrolase [Phytoactinopolyspora alkaliphila]
MSTAAHGIQRSFDDAGVFGYLHARALHEPGREIGLLPDDPVVLASVFKLPLAVAFARAVDDGRLDPTEPVTLSPDTRTPGATGFAAMSDPVTISWRDAVRSMMTVSDNAAADALLDALGTDDVNSTLAELGLTSTRVSGGTRHLYASLIADFGSPSLSEAIRQVQNATTLDELTSFDPHLTTSTVGTCRDMTALLESVWHDRAASAEQCAFIREVMAQQVWTQRLAAAFPFDDVVVAGKTGTFLALRHEVGVVEYPNGEAYAVAVFTLSTRARLILPGADAAIAQAAKLAVAVLR